MRFDRALLVFFAVAAISLLAAASATAKPTVLCTNNEEVCAKGNTWPATEFPTELTGYVGWEGTSLTLELPGLANLTCSSAKLGSLLKVQKEGPMTGEGNRWPFFTPCTPEGCTITTTPGTAPVKYPTELEAVGGGDGVLRVSKPVLNAKCKQFPLWFECSYSTTTMTIEVEGGGEKEGEHGYLSSEAPLSLVGGFSCPSTAVFHSHYEIYEPGSSVYVTN